MSRSRRGFARAVGGVGYSGAGSLGEALSRAPRAVALALLPVALGFAGTAHPQDAPSDGEIRARYLDADDRSEEWLTLLLRSPEGEALPTTLTVSLSYPGTRAAGRFKDVHLRASAGSLYAPTGELQVSCDTEPVEFLPPGARPVYEMGSESQTLVGAEGDISKEALGRMAAAKQVRGRALRLDFVLTVTQRAALAHFVDCVQAADPSAVTPSCPTPSD